ncbi:MAG TPA: sarcosine oxidase subunit delta [Caulobacteraceae bacterium]|jgi:heterotetrameric sarcosine oxidase delta subunit|nr:sarcosine oxidase subunit delta [Caulobacteraceae bacterium]
MLLIACPFCGPRAELEFRWGGDAHVARPPAACDDAELARYLFQRRNGEGLSLERWVHAFGCRQWFNLARDTATHEIAAVYRMGEAPPPALAERLS